MRWSIPDFSNAPGRYPLSDVAKATGAELVAGADPRAEIEDVRPLSEAGRAHITFIDNKKYLSAAR